MKLGVLDLPSWALEARSVKRLRRPNNLPRKITRQRPLSFRQVLRAPRQRECILSLGPGTILVKPGVVLGLSRQTLDVLRNLSDEVTSHLSCWLIPVAVEGIKTLVLIDTGASVMMMGHPLYEKIQKLRPLHLQTREMPRFEGVGGNSVPTLGSTEVGMDIGVRTSKATVMVSARRERPNFIIGADFLSAHDCDLSLREKLFPIGEQKIECIPE